MTWIKHSWSPYLFWSVNLDYFHDLFYKASLQRDAAAKNITDKSDRMGDGKAEDFSQMALLLKLQRLLKIRCHFLVSK